MGFVVVSINGIVLGDGVPSNAINPRFDRRVNASNHRGSVLLLGRSRCASKHGQDTNRRNRPCRAHSPATHHAETPFIALFQINLILPKACAV
jgi:hypothetical protein